MVKKELNAVECFCSGRRRCGPARRIAIVAAVLAAILSMFPPAEVRGQAAQVQEGESVSDKCTPLFSCETASGKVIRICGDEGEADGGDKWSGIQYRYGPANGPPELVFPKDPAKGASSLFFSHEEQKGEYRVTVRFSTGPYSYRVYSKAKGEREGSAGVTVSDSKGKVLSDIACAERPVIYIDDLRQTLPCDRQNPHGAAACRENPYKGK